MRQQRQPSSITAAQSDPNLSSSPTAINDSDVQHSSQLLDPYTGMLDTNVTVRGAAPLRLTTFVDMASDTLAVVGTPTLQSSGLHAPWEKEIPRKARPSLSNAF